MTSYVITSNVFPDFLSRPSGEATRPPSKSGFGQAVGALEVAE